MSTTDPSDQMLTYTREQLADIIDQIHMTGEPDENLIAVLRSGDAAMVKGLVNTVFESAKNDLRAALGLPQKCPCGVKNCIEPYSDECGFLEAENAMQQVLDFAPQEDDGDVAVQPEG